MANLINKLQKLVQSLSRARRKPEETEKLPAIGVLLNQDVLKQLMHIIENTHEEEYSCEETFAVLDEYVELAIKNNEAELIMPLVKRHLEICIDCREEYDSLIRILQTE